MSEQLSKFKKHAYNVVAVLLCIFVLVEVNRDLAVEYMPQWLKDFLPSDRQPKLAIFGLLGLVLVFLGYPTFKRTEKNIFFQVIDLLLVVAAIVTFGYVFVQSDSLFERFWVEGTMLGERAGLEKPFEFTIGAIALVLIFEATRRSIGWTLPILCLGFIAYAFYGPQMPDWLFPHRGTTWQQLSKSAFLQSGTMCVFGIALDVMFKYVFLFVLFGTLLEQTGATGYIINMARWLFRNSSGGPAKVAVLSSGLMGSLSGSAVANTATTGAFTIPLMKSTGFDADTAAGVEAAASSGGALMPPIMGAGAYMMLDILSKIDPNITYLKIIQAALIPAILYYVALLLAVHFHSKRIGAAKETAQVSETVDSGEMVWYQGVVFLGSFVILISMLLLGKTPFLSVTVSLLGIWLLSLFSKHTRIGHKQIYEAMVRAARSGTALIVAASCVGIILSVVAITGLGPSLPAKVQTLAGDSAFLALLLLMTSTIVLGMGLPSAVCYLLVALTVGSVLSVLDTPPLAAHLFIFYFGMMSMVTPPVALAAYAGAAIAKGNIMKSALAAFRFALVGFALPFAFVLKPELLMLTRENEPASILMIVMHVSITLVAIVGLAAAISGYAFRNIGWLVRVVLFAASMAVFFTRLEATELFVQLASLLIVVGILGFEFTKRDRSQVESVPSV